MYRMLYKKPGEDTWQEGSTFSDESLTPDAREMLVERRAREGIETMFEKVPETEGDQDVP